jgi:hypothetical protein
MSVNLRVDHLKVLLGSALGVILLALSSCAMLGGEGAVRSTSTPALLSQWATKATASSYYALPDWSPSRATGVPEITICADDARAWASARGNGVEWLQLEYAQPVYATAINIHQTYGRGGVSRVILVDAAGNGEVVWEGVDALEPCPGILAVLVPPASVKVATVRIDLDESRAGMWNQIDAVELVGVP